MDNQVAGMPKKPFFEKSMLVFLFLAIFLLIAGNYFFGAIVMAGKKAFLTEKTIAGISNWVGFFAVILLMLAVMGLSNADEKKGVRVLKTMTAWLPFWCVCEIMVLLFPKLSNIQGATSVKSWFLIRVIAIVLSLLLITITLFSGVYNTTARLKSRGLLTAFLQLLVHPLSFLLCILLVVVAFVLSESIHMLIIYVPIAGIRFSFTVNMTIFFVESLLATGVTYWFLGYMKKRVQNWESKTWQKKMAKLQREAQNMPQNAMGQPVVRPSLVFEKFSLVQIIFAGIILVIDLGLLVPVLLFHGRVSRQSIYQNVTEAVSQSESALLMGDMNKACKDMMLARDKIEAVKTYAEEGQISFSELLRRQPEDVLIWELYLSKAEGIEELEKYVLTENSKNSELKMLLFDWYSHQKSSKLTKQQKAYQQELLSEYIATQGYVSELPKLPKSDKGKKKVIKKLDDKMGFVPAYAECLMYLTNVGRKGEVSDVWSLIETAKKYPDDITVQYLTGVICAAGANDNAGYYDDAKEIIMRFVELSEKEKKISKNELLQRKLKAVELLIRVKGYDEAVELLEDMDTSKNTAMEEQIGLLRLYCADRNGDSKECYQTAAELIEEGVDNVQVNYFYGVGALKEGKPKKMTEALERSAELVCDESLTGSQLVNAETSFYIMMQYAVVNDSETWTDYKYRYYPEMEEDDKEDLSEFLYNYMEAMNAYYNDREYETALERINDVLDEREDLSYAWYLKGAILFSMEEFDESEECYQNAIGLNADNPTFLYAMANTLEAKKDYQSAYSVSGKVQELLPLINHEQDWYGLGVHNEHLYNWLAGQQEGEEEE